MPLNAPWKVSGATPAGQPKKASGKLATPATGKLPKFWGGKSVTKDARQKAPKKSPSKK